MPDDWVRGFAFQSDMGEFKTFERFRGMVIALQVEAEGYAPIYVPRVVLGAYDQEPLIIRMNKQTSIEGIVVDAETGKPLAGAFISTFDKNHPLDIHGVAPGRRTTEATRTGPWIILSLVEHPYPMALFLEARESDKDIYRFENLIPGKYDIVEMIPGEGFAKSGRSTYLELQPGETKTLNFLRTGSTRLYGKVTEADGSPIKNVAVYARGTPKDAKKPLSDEIRFEYSGTAITDADGHYEIAGLRPGDYQLQAEVVTIHKPGEIEAARRTGKFPERPKPRKTTSVFTIEEGDKEVGLDVVFPEKE